MRHLAIAVILTSLGGVAHAEGVADEAAVPCRDWQRHVWLPRFEEKRRLAERESFAVAFVGDSITHNWEKYGTNVWAANFSTGRCKAVNFGISGDRTENVLWRLRHGQFGKSGFKAVVLMIGTNNVGHRSPEDETPLDTVLGVKTVLDEIKAQAPTAKVILHPILPRERRPDSPVWKRCVAANEAFCALADGKDVLWCDFNARFVGADGSLLTDLVPDGVHPIERGYEIWAEALKPYLDYALGMTDRPPKEAKGPSTNLQMDWLKMGPQYPHHKIGPQQPGGRLGAKRREIRANAGHWFDLVMLGDSITHFWEVYGADVLQKRLGSYSILIAGNGSAGTTCTWWLAENGMLDSYQTRFVSLMIGTNDSAWEWKPEWTTSMIGKILETIRRKQPNAVVLLFPILPRGKDASDPVRIRCEQVNALVRDCADGKQVRWVDVYRDFMHEDGTLRKELYCDDLLHLGVKGYEVWAKALEGHLRQNRFDVTTKGEL